MHTPQDVLVGLAAGALVLWGMALIFRFLDKHPEKENWFLAGGILLGIAALVYFSLKLYPMDYVDGKLLVDPQKMMKDGFGDTGKLIAFCVGRLIEKKWIRFKPVFSKRNLAAGAAGAVLLFFLIETVGAPMKELFGLHWGAFAQNMIIFLYIVAGWPLVMKACGKHEEAPEEAVHAF